MTTRERISRSILTPLDALGGCGGCALYVAMANRQGACGSGLVVRLLREAAAERYPSDFAVSVSP